ncbi:MAG TPA: zinc ribbon domain-containing protein [Bryobacteraceae bacterium]|nr:zinc ribbon domain-containing protein [Bryobacteraceae bacterium]
MPDFCSCGATLPPDAVFCHKCGKPQREITVPEIQPPPETPAPAPTPFVPPAPRLEAVPLNFRNPIAVRIALLVAFTATVLGFVLPLLNWLAAGFFAVYFYCRKTGLQLNVGGGMKLGWITGLLMFGPWAMIFLAEQLPAARSGKLASMIQEQMTRSLPASDPAVQQLTGFLQSGPGIAAAIAFSLIALFFFIIGLSVAGGALGAKMAKPSRTT